MARSSSELPLRDRQQARLLVLPVPGAPASNPFSQAKAGCAAMPSAKDTIGGLPQDLRQVRGFVSVSLRVTVRKSPRCSFSVIVRLQSPMSKPLGHLRPVRAGPQATSRSRRRWRRSARWKGFGLSGRLDSRSSCPWASRKPVVPLPTIRRVRLRRAKPAMVRMPASGAFSVTCPRPRCVRRRADRELLPVLLGDARRSRRASSGPRVWRGTCSVRSRPRPSTASAIDLLPMSSDSLGRTNRFVLAVTSRNASSSEIG